MRILQVAPFYPPHVGGIESHVAALSRKLVQAGNEVAIFTANLPRLKSYEVVEGIEIYRFRSLCSPLNNPVVPGLSAKLLRNHEFDVVHAHGHFHMSSTFALLSNVFVKKPFVLSSHGVVLELRGWRRAVEAIFNNTVGKWTLHSIDRIIVSTASQIEILEGLGAKRQRMVVIPLWVDLDRERSQTNGRDFRRTYKLGDRKIVLFVGRLLPVKGLTYLIEAARHTQLKPAIAIVGGEAPGYGGTRDGLEGQVRAGGLGEDVFFLGEFSKDELGAAYQAADLFVTPSLGEGQALTVLEAMLYGKCVLGTNVPGVRDVVKDGWNGVLVEPRDPVALAQKIDYLLGDDALRERLGEQARRDIEQEYDPDVIVGKFLDLYREVQRNPMRGKN